jgi:3-hydroxyisobutyrate dehydrogenase-like beta-hydroxyacid dehydrogenase
MASTDTRTGLVSTTGRESMKVGFIGLGRMGRGIAGRVRGAGHDLVVYNRTPKTAEEFVSEGGTVAPSVAGACEDRDVVITMLANDAALGEVALGSGGIRESLPEGAIHMVMGTHGVAAVQGLAAAHAEAMQILVAAPVLGRPDLAASGQLGIVAAGQPAAVERCAPLLDVIGRRTFAAGEKPEGATVIKLANNFVLSWA